MRVRFGLQHSQLHSAGCILICIFTAFTAPAAAASTWLWGVAAAAAIVALTTFRYKTIDLLFERVSDPSADLDHAILHWILALSAFVPFLKVRRGWECSLGQ